MSSSISSCGLRFPKYQDWMSSCISTMSGLRSWDTERSTWKARENGFEPYHHDSQAGLEVVLNALLVCHNLAMQLPSIVLLRACRAANAICRIPARRVQFVLTEHYAGSRNL